MFSDGTRSPPSGTYDYEPIASTDVPPYPHAQTLTLKTCKDGSDYWLYCIHFSCPKGNTIAQAMPIDWSKDHYKSHTVTMRPGERIIAAKVDIGGIFGDIPFQMQFVVYNYL